ncbi:MAG: formylglycine-generating enzyme family protein [Bacteroidales bacterium]|nr:formylglycine-generating enzyme family protein [Bacteroidales bacterium]
MSEANCRVTCRIFAMRDYGMRRIGFRLALSKSTFTVNGVSFNMKYVEGGTFKMGAQKTNSSGDNYDAEAENDEKPVHEVTLSSYNIGETEVTQALWKAVMGADNNPSKSKNDSYPVEQVSWNDVQTFITKLNELTGETFRLPTEAEWEYAARGGKKSEGYKYAGSNNLDDVAWFKSNSNSINTVAMKQPNELGLYDMIGNASEWCFDWYGVYSSATQTNPTGAPTGSNHVNRGGCWGSPAACSRVSFRRSHTPEYNDDRLGFRLAY